MGSALKMMATFDPVERTMQQSVSVAASPELLHAPWWPQGWWRIVDTRIGIVPIPIYVILVQGFFKIFVPLAIGSIAAGIVGTLVGMLLGLGAFHTFFFVVIPIMAGGVGEGAIPLSAGYAEILGDMLDLEPHDLTRPQSAAITETEQNARLEARGHRQQPLDLICAHHQRKLLRLTNVIDLFGQVQSA
jgi:uncharacterized protein (DUF697 family)